MLEYEFCFSGRFELQQHRNNSVSICVSVLLAVLVCNSALQARPILSEPLSKCWSYSEPILKTGGVVADGSAVYLVNEDSTVKALDRVSGSIIWSAELGGTVDSSLVAAGSSILVLTRAASNGRHSTSFYIRAVSKATGITQWVTPLPASDRYSIRPADDSTLIIENGSVITVLDVGNGQARWSRGGVLIGGFGTNTDDGPIAAAPGPGKLELLSLSDGHPVAKFERAPVPMAVASKTGQAIVFGDARGVIEARHGGKRVWRYKAGGGISRLVVVEDDVIAASDDNFLYSISLRNGNVGWKRKLPGRISSVDRLGAGRVGVTVVGEKTAYVIDVTDGRFFEQLTLADDDEFVGYPLRGDNTFLAALTTRGLTAFSSNCGHEKAAIKPAAS